MGFIQNLRKKQKSIGDLAIDEQNKGHIKTAGRLFDYVYELKFEEYNQYCEMHKAAVKQLKCIVNPKDFFAHEEIVYDLARLKKSQK